MFHFKKIVAPFLFPVPLCLEILILGVVLLLFTRKQKCGKALVSIGTVLLLLFSLSPVSGLLIASLEHSYNVQKESQKGVHWIVVLGAGGFCDPDIPIGNQLPAASLYRLIEGVRLHKELPESKLVLTGKTGGLIMAEVAVLICGVPRSEILVFPELLDTEEESVAMKSLVKEDSLILVTSASHLPRAMALFEREGMHPLPAPAEYLARKECPNPYPPMPNPGALEQSTAAFYEYLGLIWTKLRTGL
jgi:uncharacterized SAM-binding protein YcdF (DUF218 family)